MTDTPHARPFADFLREQAKGTSHQELYDLLRELTERVTETGKKGSITYTVTVQPTKGVDALTVSDEIKVKLPEHDRPSSLFFADHDYNLTGEDPAQPSFDSLAPVPPPPGIDPKTGELDEDADDDPYAREA